MRSKIVGSIALFGIFALSAAANAQTPAIAQTAANAQTEGFQTKTFYAGPRIWLGNLNGAVAFGAQVERGFSKPGAYGSGVISGGVGIDVYSWSHDYGSFGSYHYSVVPVQVFGNYHFALASNKRIDPYVGLALVYQHVSASWKGSGISTASASGSSTDFAGQAGVRYFISNRFAVQGQVGFGYGTLGLGATWRL
jgi:hypothetical protein